jgi:signal transduction histidine kinase
VTVPAHERRLYDLFAASIALNAELSIDALLQKLVEAAAGLTGARYGALGVIDETGDQLERFLTTGLDVEEHAAIGEVPRGGGILGVLIRESKPLRLERIGDDPRAVGFPEHHPPMASFLGVPVMLRGVAYGNLYLTEKPGGVSFTAEDQELVELLAAQAAVAIENARLYESAKRWSRQLETLHEVMRSLVEDMDLDTLLELVCARLRELIGARVALIALAQPTGDELVISAVAAESGEGASLIGYRLSARESKCGRVLARRQSARVDSMLDDPEVDPEEARRLGARTGIFVPLVARGEAIGVVAVHDKLGGDSRFSDEDLRLAEIFGARAAVAVSLSERVARDTLRRVVSAQELERRRLARELHDETGQALTSILLGVRAIRASSTPDDAERAEADVRGLIVQALQDVRALAVELRPSALDDFGLVAAVERLANTFQARSGLETVIQANIDKRLPAETETVLYRVVQEALTNVIKHSGAEHVSIVLRSRDGAVAVTIDDDGQGFAAADVRGDALGLLGMRERLALVGGTLEVESSPESGTTIAAEVPASTGVLRRDGMHEERREILQGGHALEAGDPHHDPTRKLDP